MGNAVLLCGFWHVFRDASILWGLHAYYGMKASHIKGFMHKGVVGDVGMG